MLLVDRPPIEVHLHVAITENKRHYTISATQRALDILEEAARASCSIKDLPIMFRDTQSETTNWMNRRAHGLIIRTIAFAEKHRNGQTTTLTAEEEDAGAREVQVITFAIDLLRELCTR